MNSGESRGLFDVVGKRVVVTGAGDGLGWTMAEALASAGAAVALVSRSVEKLERRVREIAECGGTALSVRCDVRESADVTAMVQSVVAAWGRIDVLINNAGVAAEAGHMPERVPHDLFEDTVRTNLIGLWHCCRETAPYMLRDGNGGSIINVASIAGLAGWRDSPPAYQATKAAVINLTRHLACSWGDRGVRVNALAPGWFPSPMTRTLLQLGSMAKHVVAATPLCRLGDPRELIGPVLFLASDASSFVTGQTLVVDGGFSAGSGQFSLPDDVYRALGMAMPDDVGTHIKP